MQAGQAILITLRLTFLGNQLVTNTKLDFETKNSYTVRVRTTDQGGLSFEKAFTITVTDVVLAGDTNGDDLVDINDFVSLRHNFGKSDATRLMGDLNDDGRVDINDFVLLRRDFGKRV